MFGIQTDFLDVHHQGLRGHSYIDGLGKSLCSGFKLTSYMLSSPRPKGTQLQIWSGKEPVFGIKTDFLYALNTKA